MDAEGRQHFCSKCGSLPQNAGDLAGLHKYLKTKIAPGLDNVTNGIIKCSDRNMLEHLKTLFNDIMESGYCPISWNQGLICSKYKSGEKDDPNNYRGIT